MMGALQDIDLTIPKTNKKQACCSEKSLISIHF